MKVKSLHGHEITAKYWPLVLALGEVSSKSVVVLGGVLEVNSLLWLLPVGRQGADLLLGLGLDLVDGGLGLAGHFLDLGLQVLG